MNAISTRPHTSRSCAAWAALACVVVASFTSAPAQAQATDDKGTTWYKSSLGGNGVLWSGRMSDGEAVYLWDYNGDGVWENWAYDIDGNGDYDVYYWAGDPGKPPRGFAYCGAGGRWIARIYDTDNNGTYDDYWSFEHPGTINLGELLATKNAAYTAFVQAQQRGATNLASKKLYNDYVMATYAYEVGKVQAVIQGPQDERTRRY